MNCEIVVTSTALSELEANCLKESLKEYPENPRYSSDLTSEVHILVINKHDPQKLWLKSKKFMYVVSYRPDMRVVDYKEICNNQKYNKLPSLLKFPTIKPFDNLTISLCRLEEDLMDKTEKIIKQNGGTVINHLTNETDVMISMIAEGRRYDAALAWEVAVVSPDWCYDSVDRGLPLNTKFYKLVKNVTDVVKKLNYENEDDTVGSELVVKTYQLGKRDQACDWEKLKEWRTHEEDRKLEEYIRTKYKKGGTHYNSSDDSFTLLNSSLDMDLSLKRKIEELENDAGEEVVIKPKKRSKAAGLWNSVLQKQTTSATNGNNKIKHEGVGSKVKKEIINGPILQDLKFKTIGFTESEELKLRKVISKFGGNVVDDSDDDDDKNIVNFTIVSFKYDKPVQGDNLITELAIERFIYNEKVDSGGYLWCKPFYISPEITIKQFRQHIFREMPELHETTDKIVVSITGFQGTDLSQIERLFQEKLGKWMDFRPLFTKACELLVVGHNTTNNTSSTKKQQLARRWEVSVMLAEDLFARIIQVSA